MTTLSVVIPAFNEETGIANIVERVLAVQGELSKVGVDKLELLVVDDGSADQTVQITQNLASHDHVIRLICHKQNRGYGAALKTGFSQANGELIGFLDADGTYPPEYFPQLCKMAINGSDLVIGSRMVGEQSQMPITRRIGNIFFARLVSLLGRQHITDSASGMRVFNREVLEKIYPLPDGLNLTPVMSTKALHEGIEMSEVPIPYSERVGRSKLSVVRDGSLFLQSIIWTVLTYNPVRVLGMIGLIGVLITGLIALWLVITRLSGTTTLGPGGVIAISSALVAGVTGISIYALGATFNYLVALFYKRPIQQGLFGRPLFTPSLDHYFGWFGFFGLLIGIALGSITIILGLRGWEVTRLWLYMLGSAMFILTGVQLIIYWILMRVLEELSQREKLAESDFNGEWKI
jgi:glycosyltransferase involved in cell wall biosynthesis